MNRKLLLLFCLGFSLSLHAQPWQSVSEFPATERDDGCSFTIGNKAYCGTGLAPWWDELGDFYRFDMSIDTWLPISSPTSAIARQYAVGFSDGAHGYVFGGVDGAAYLGDMWQYDPTSDSWTAKTPIPALGRSGSASFVLNNTAFILGGKDSAGTILKEVWAYDMINDIWTQKPDLPLNGSWRASAASLNGKGYLLFGKDSAGNYSNTLYESDASVDNWTQISTFPLPGRTYAAMKAMNDNLVVLAGLDSAGNYLNDHWAIHPTELIWHELDSIPSLGRKGGMCFNNASTIYYTTGILKDGTRLRQTWKNEHPTVVKPIVESSTVELFPNPTKDFLSLHGINKSLNEATSIRLFNSLGALVFETQISGNATTINCAAFSNGIYMALIGTRNDVVCKPFVVRR